MALRSRSWYDLLMCHHVIYYCFFIYIYYIFFYALWLSYILSDESNTEESIEMEVLTKNQPELESMVPSKENEKSKYPWHALVSYVDELTVGGRRDSKGRYIDGLGNFPGFGRNKTEKIPQNCFPDHCYKE